MRRGAAAGGLLASAGVAAVTALGAVQAAPVHADRQLLSRLAAETGVVTSPPQPSVREYLAVLMGHLLKKLFGWIHLPQIDLGGAGTFLAIAARLFAWLLLAGALALLVLAVYRALRRRERREERPEEPEASPLPPPPPSDPAHWWARLEAALGAGDVAAALSSLWLWTGFRLAGPELEPSWTSRELLQRAGRPDLAPALGRLDGWRFGPEPPEPPEIRGLANRLREAVS